MLRAFFTVLLLAGSAAAQAAGDCKSCASGGGIVDKQAGICFPKSVQGFEAVPSTEAQRKQLAEYRNSIAAGYNVPAMRLAVTFYVYDREEQGEDADLNEVRAAIGEILQYHSGSKMEMAGGTQLPLGGRKTAAKGAMFTWSDSHADYGSFLWIVPKGTRYLKVRATYPRPPGSEGETMERALEAVNELARNVCLAK
jgi:hypothetical protein